MGTIFTRTAGRSAQQSLGVYVPSDAETAAWPLFDAHQGNGRALFWDASERQFTGAAIGDYPIPWKGEMGFQCQERVAERQFGVGVSGRHPVRVPDGSQAPGRFCWGFGIEDDSGASPNVMTAGVNGDLKCLSVIDRLGNETSRVPLIRPGGFSVFARFRAAGTGAMLASEQDDGALSFIFGLHASGQPYCATRFAPAGGGSAALLAPGNYGSGSSPTNMVTVYDSAAQTMRTWINDTLAATGTVALDVVNNADTAMPRIGGIGKSTNPLPYRGYINALGYLPSPVLNDDAKRALITNLLNTK